MSLRVERQMYGSMTGGSKRMNAPPDNEGNSSTSLLGSLFTLLDAGVEAQQCASQTALAGWFTERQCVLCGRGAGIGRRAGEKK